MATTVTGSGHQTTCGEPQDAFRNNFADLLPAGPRLGRSEGLEAAVAVVSDGLSSATHSAAGASLTTAFASVMFTDAFEDVTWDAVSSAELCERMRRGFDATVAAVSAALGAASNHVAMLSARDFGSTLTAFIFRPPWLIVLNLGDGFVVVQRGDGDLALVAAPYVDPETAGVTPVVLSPSATTRLQVRCVLDDEISGVAASSDGLADVGLDWEAREPTAPHAEFFGSLLDKVSKQELTGADVATFLRSPRMRDKTSDDLTLIAIARRSTPSEPSPD